MRPSPSASSGSPVRSDDSSIARPARNRQRLRSTDVRCTCFMVRSLSRKISQLYDDVLAPSGLKGTQFSVLLQARTRRGHAPLTVSALAAVLHTDRTTMTRNLRTLEQAGLITLQAGTDARSRCVVVTEAGEAAFRQALDLWKQAQAQIRTLCGAEQIMALEQLVDHLLPRMVAVQEAAQ